MLYENRTGPDQELMQATSSKNAVCYTSDDEDERRGDGGAAGGQGGGGAGGGGGGGNRHGSGLGRLRSNKNN